MAESMEDVTILKASHCPNIGDQFLQVNQETNAATVDIINKGQLKITNWLSHHSLFNLVMCFDNFIILQATYISGHDNQVADALSRFIVRKFKTLHPQPMPSVQSEDCWVYMSKPV